MSRSQFVQYRDFLEVSSASIFISTLKTKDFISIETILLIGPANAKGQSIPMQSFRVWYYHV